MGRGRSRFGQAVALQANGASILALEAQILKMLSKQDRQRMDLRWSETSRWGEWEKHLEAMPGRRIKGPPKSGAPQRETGCWIRGNARAARTKRSTCCSCCKRNGLTENDCPSVARMPGPALGVRGRLAESLRAPRSFRPRVQPRNLCAGKS